VSNTTDKAKGSPADSNPVVPEGAVSVQDEAEAQRFTAKLRLLGDGAGYFLVLVLVGLAGLLALGVSGSSGLLLLWAVPIVTATVVLGSVWYTRKLQYDQPSLVWYMSLMAGLFLTGVGWAAFVLQALDLDQSVRQSAALMLLAVEVLIGALLFAVDLMVVAAYLLGVVLAYLLFVLVADQTPGLAVSGLLAGVAVTAVLLSLWSYRFQRLLVRSLTEIKQLRPRHERLAEEGEELKRRLAAQEKHQQEVKQELYVAKDAAEAASVAKTEFLATMSHEIRTPLNGIVPILEILRETHLDTEQQEFVSTALNSSHHLLNLINDILDYSKIEAGKLELESIELEIPELIESVIALLKKSAERRGTRLVSKIAHNAPLRVRGDPFRLRQILTNLVGNAIKFTERGTVTVEVNRHASAAKEVVLAFAVRDTGLGMSEKVLGRLFQMFSQADATTTRKHGGTGLGLVICKKLVEMMGGRIGVKSEQGKGSVFWFLVPMRKTLTEVPMTRASLEGGRVLMAGFEEAEQKRITGFLDSWGMVNEQATTAMDALNKLKAPVSLGSSWGYDVLLLDAQSIGREVGGLIYGIGKVFELSSLVVIAVDSFPSMADQLEEQNVTEVMQRPLQKSDLRGRLHRLLDVQTTRNPAREQLEDRYPVMPDAAFSWEDGHEAERTLPLPAAARLETAPDKLKPKLKPKLEPKPKPPEVKESKLEGRVLVVEDNPVNLSVMRKLLQRLDLEATAAGDGVEAVALYGEQEFDLILMDVQMPNMDGLEATRQIRRMEQEQGLPHMAIVAMTANAMAGDRERCLESGMDDYMSKPVKPTDLKKMLQHWLPGGVETQERPKTPPSPPRAKPQTAPPPTAAAAPAAGENPLDAGVLEELFEIMEEDALSLLRQYLGNSIELLKEIVRAVAAKDAEGLVLPAHSLKSSSANVGAMRVSALAKKLEFMGRENNMDKAAGGWKKLQEEYSLSADALKVIIQRGGL